MDFPNKYALSLFFTKCNLNCPFCYNRHVVEGQGNYSINDILEKKHRIENCFVNANIGMVFSGGEPTIQNDFEEIINIFGDSPLSIHTNGLKLPNIKNPFESVILSLKIEDCGIPSDYIDRIKKAIEYYGDCQHKEINVVKIDEYHKEIADYLRQLDDYLHKYNFTIRVSEYIKP